MVQQKQIRLETLRLQVRSLASLSGLKIHCCSELCCRSQSQLGSNVAVAVALAGDYSSDETPSLETSICCECNPKKEKKKKKKKKERKKSVYVLY